MQQKIKGDVRIVFTLHVDQLTGCKPGKGYIVIIKRGDKIHTTSSAVIADREGNVIVNTTRVFTSTMQKESNYKYKTKELKIRALELPQRITVTSLTYDISKHVVNDCFPERKLIVKGDGGSEQMILKLEGTEEKMYNRQHSIESASNASLTSYMRAPSSPSQTASSVREEASNLSTRSFRDFENVIESVIASAGIKGCDSSGTSVKSDAHDAQKAEVPSLKCLSDATSKKEVPKGEIDWPIAESHMNKSLCESSESSAGVKHQTSVPFQGTKARLPLKVPSKRIVIPQGDIALAVIDQISSAVRRDALSLVHQPTTHTSEGVRLTLSSFFNSNEEKLEGFVLNFLAHLAVKVCQESRLLGEWLDLLTHVMYRSIASSSCIKSSRDIIRQTSAQFIQLSRASISDFITQGKELLRGIRSGKGSSVDIMIFWLAGLESCASEITLLLVKPVQRVIKNFASALTTPHEIYLTNNEKLAANIVLLCSTLDSTLSALIPGGNEDIRQASPILRIFLSNLFSSIFCTIVRTVVMGLDEMAGKSREKSSYSLRVLTTLKWWARKVALLSVLSHSLMPLVAYCDFVLLPDILRENEDYKCFMRNWLPSVQSSKEFMCGSSTPDVAVSAPDSDDLWSVSLFDTFSAFLIPEKENTEALSDTDASVACLLEILNGNHDEVARVVLEEEVFPKSGFNGLICTLSRPDCVMPLLDAAAS